MLGFEHSRARRPHRVVVVDDREQRQTRLHPTWNGTIVSQARAKQLASLRVRTPRVRSEPERAAMHSSYEDGSLLEVERATKGELRAEDPVLPDVRVPEATRVSDRFRPEDRSGDRKAVEAEVCQCERSPVAGDSIDDRLRSAIE